AAGELAPGTFTRARKATLWVRFAAPPPKSIVPASGSKSLSASPEVPAGNGCAKAKIKRYSQPSGYCQELFRLVDLMAGITRNAHTAHEPSRLFTYPTVRPIATGSPVAS